MAKGGLGSFATLITAILLFALQQKNAAALAPTRSGRLLQHIWFNTAFAGDADLTSTVKYFGLELPPGTAAPLSAEISGSWTPPSDSGNANYWRFECRFSDSVAFAFASVNGRLICQHGAYNNSANGITDATEFRVLSKTQNLVLSLKVLVLDERADDVRASVVWCVEKDSGGEQCTPLPMGSVLDPEVPSPEQRRLELQKGLATGWGSWLHRNILSIVLLPDAATVSLQLCEISSRSCVRDAVIDRNGGATTSGENPVRVGAHAVDHSYSQAYVATPFGLNVSIAYTAAGRDLDVLVEPVASPPDTNLSDWALIFAGSFAWGRLGVAVATAAGLELRAQGLAEQQAVVLSPVGGAPLLECANCTRTPQPHVAVLPLLAEGGAVGLTTRRGVDLAEVVRRVEAADAARRGSLEARFGAENVELATACEAAVGWRQIFVPIEAGPVMPVTYGFGWLSPQPVSDDWRYVLFCWDNLFASLIAGVLGWREAAYSNLVQIVKAKSFGGFVPNWASGASRNQVSEPAVGSRVLLELYSRFGDEWIVELLFDDLLDWNNWLWTRRRVRADDDDDGFVTLGNDYAAPNCDSPGSCGFAGESGLDQSPLWDCPGAGADGAGGNCSIAVPVPGPGVLALADVQSTSLFVQDAAALARLAEVIGRPQSLVELLEERADRMRRSLRALWDPEQLAFADRYVLTTGEFSRRITPNILYPLFADAASAEQASAMVERHLTNRSELCVSAEWEEVNDEDACYWGLPSISRSDRASVYWRGLTWGPQTILAYWALDALPAVPEVAAARIALAKQKTAQMMDMWRRRRHICENYPPFSPSSNVLPGDGQRNDECTGWQFYHWGALNGLTTLLEAER